MKPAAIISVLHQRTFSVLESYVRDNPQTTVFAWQGPEDPELVRRIAAAGGEMVPLHVPLPLFQRARLKAESRWRLSRLEGVLRGPAWSRFCSERGWPGERLRALIGRRARADLPVIAAVVAALERIAASHTVRLVVVSEDFSPWARAAVLWARERGIPSLHLSHSLTVCEPYTVHRRIVSDVLAVFGERGAEGYLDADADAFVGQIRLTGNPAWDDYPQMVSRREAIRCGLAIRHELPPSRPWVVFATTVVETQTAFCDDGVFEETLRAFLEACRTLADEGRGVEIIVKDRPPNRTFGSARLGELVTELGMAKEHIHYVVDEMKEWVVAADAVVSVASNVSVEALLAATPAVNLVTEVDVALTPSFDAESGIVEAEGHELAAALGRILSDPDHRVRLRDQMRRAASRYNLGLDGTATTRVVRLMEELASPVAAEGSHGRSAASREGERV